MAGEDTKEVLAGGRSRPGSVRPRLHGNILAEATVRTLRAANAKMGDMAGNSAGRYLAAEKEFDDAFNRAAVQGYIIRD